MKLVHLLLLLILLSACLPKTAKRKTYIDSNVVVNDTLFLKREVQNDTVYHTIFVAPKQAQLAQQYVYLLDQQDSINIRDYVTTLVKEHIKLQKFDTYGLASTWRPIFQYKSKYYLYQPSDSGNKGTRLLTDSLLMIYYMDGYDPIAMSALTKIKDGVFNIKPSHAIPGATGIPDEVNIYIINKQTNLAVWMYKYKNGYAEYLLMVPWENADKYPIIVNMSAFQKEPEFENFDKVDFKRLIAQATK